MYWNARKFRHFRVKNNRGITCFLGGQLRSVIDHSRLLCYEVLIFGEFVHFWSGAAGYDLKQLALNAFGNKDENRNDWTAQLTQAKSDFPGVTYKNLMDFTGQGTLSVTKENSDEPGLLKGFRAVENDYTMKFFQEDFLREWRCSWSSLRRILFPAI